MEQYVVKNQKKLRLGITSGTCCAAAAQAAALQLLFGIRSQTVTLLTPKGIVVEIPVYPMDGSSECVSYKVVKDSGDDPDVTNGTDICATVEFIQHSYGNLDKKLEETARNRHMFRSDTYGNLFLDGGIGIGRVTKEGLEQSIGQAAINVVPRQMIFEAVGDVCEKANCHEPLRITVWIPEGEALAKRTFNPKLGIEGGLSVLGTSGIIEPMSEQAILATIETEIRQFCATGGKTLLVTPGNYGQAYASRYLKLDLKSSVKSSNYIGETMDYAIAYGVKNMLLVGNIGKLVKLAAGIFQTHSKVADGRAEIFAAHAAMAGASPEVVRQIYTCINTDRMLDVLEEHGLREMVMERITEAIRQHVMGRTGDAMKMGVVLFSEKYGYLGQTLETEAILQAFYEEHMGNTDSVIS